MCIFLNICDKIRYIKYTRMTTSLSSETKHIIVRQTDKVTYKTVVIKKREIDNMCLLYQRKPRKLYTKNIFVFCSMNDRTTDKVSCILINLW